MAENNTHDGTVIEGLNLNHPRVPYKVAEFLYRPLVIFFFVFRAVSSTKQPSKASRYAVETSMHT